jgi:protein gp37
VFDNQVPREWRADLWALISDCPNLDWLLLTKRPQNIAKMLPPAWPWPHVWLGTTVESPHEYRRIKYLQAIPATVRFLSMEPLLARCDDIPLDGIHWVISGGESGTHHRPIDKGWVRSIRDQCAARGIAFHHKQWGGVRPKANGCELDGREWKEFPRLAA